MAIKKIYLLPNLVTTANLFCGFYSIIASIKGDFVLASWAILLAGIFDLLDGRVARMAKATSRFGVEYDSLSDLLSFGVAPSILLFRSALESFDRVGWLAAFLYVVCGALRLARFNVSTEIQPKGYFQGLPIPGAAGAVATALIFTEDMGLSVLRTGVVVVLAFGLALLMVSSVQFPSFKEFNWRARASFPYLMIGVVAMILIVAHPQIALFGVCFGYIILSILWNVWRLMHSKKASPREVAEK